MHGFLPFGSTYEWGNNGNDKSHSVDPARVLLQLYMLLLQPRKYERSDNTHAR